MNLEPGIAALWCSCGSLGPNTQFILQPLLPQNLGNITKTTLSESHVDTGQNKPQQIITISEQKLYWLV